jgi:hypothetical protein
MHVCRALIALLEPDAAAWTRWGQGAHELAPGVTEWQHLQWDAASGGYAQDPEAEGATNVGAARLVRIGNVMAYLSVAFGPPLSPVYPEGTNRFTPDRTTQIRVVQESVDALLERLRGS